MASNHFSIDLKNKLDMLTTLEQKLEKMNTKCFIRLNVGGTEFATLKSTLNTYQRVGRIGNKASGPNLLESLASGIVDVQHDHYHVIFIDRNPKYFSHVLDYLRAAKEENETFELPDEESAIRGIMKEAQFYKMVDLEDLTVKKLMTCWFPNSFLTYEQKRDMVNLCKLPKTSKWRRIFKASSDGFSAADFHSRCDGFQGTLTIIKTTDSLIFGGYTEASWSHSDVYKEDKNAFIFSLVNKDNCPVKMPCCKNLSAIFCHTDYGPTFGAGHDIFIENMSNSNPNSYANLGDCFKHPTYEYGSDEAKCFLGGSIDFKTSDIEVYCNE